jgi:hypothetical protein
MSEINAQKELLIKLQEKMDSVERKIKKLERLTR